MSEFKKARERISEIDLKMAELFEERMDAARIIADYKRKTGKPVDDFEREDILIKKNTDAVKNKEYVPYYIDFIKNNIKLSKTFQHRRLGGMKIAVSGSKGAFADIVANRLFPDAVNISYPDFASAYKAAENGECDLVLLPLENSFGGDVTAVLDLAYFGNLNINGIYETCIIQNLLGLEGADISDIKTVMSHPQALMQCSDFIEKNGFETIETENTAKAAFEVKKHNDKTLAAIGSERAAKSNGLKVLKYHINQSDDNTTRFGVFTRTRKVPDNNDNRFVLMFTVENDVGSLSKVLSIIGEYGFNLVSLKSRPTKQKNWNYYFYAEGDGNIYSENGINMIKKLESSCRDIKLLGSFEAITSLN